MGKIGIFFSACFFLLSASANAEIITARIEVGSNDGVSTPVNWNGSLCSVLGANGINGHVANVVGLWLEPSQGDAVYQNGDCAMFNFNTFNGRDGMQLAVYENAAYVLNLYATQVGTYQQVHIVKELNTIVGDFAFLETLLGPSTVNGSINKVYLSGGLSK